MFYEVVGGDRITGSRINGRLLTGGGDWLTVGTDGYGTIDVRIHCQTDDGAVTFVEYTA